MSKWPMRTRPLGACSSSFGIADTTSRGDRGSQAGGAASGAVSRPPGWPPSAPLRAWQRDRRGEPDLPISSAAGSVGHGGVGGPGIQRMVTGQRLEAFGVSKAAWRLRRPLSHRAWTRPAGASRSVPGASSWGWGRYPIALWERRWCRPCPRLCMPRLDVRPGVARKQGGKTRHCPSRGTPLGQAWLLGCDPAGFRWRVWPRGQGGELGCGQPAADDWPQDWGRGTALGGRTSDVLVDIGLAGGLRPALRRRRGIASAAWRSPLGGARLWRAPGGGPGGQIGSATAARGTWRARPLVGRSSPVGPGASRGGECSRPRRAMAAHLSKAPASG